MRRTFPSLQFSACALLCLLVVGIISGAPSTANAFPWTPASSVIPYPGPGIPTPLATPGKDFSNHRDRNAAAVGDAEQVIAWDGAPGTSGVRDAFDYSGSRIGYPEVELDQEVDALANVGDALYDAVIADRAALLFSVGNTAPAPGGLGDNHIYFEAAHGFGPPPVADGIWAAPLDIDGMAPPDDVDGLEVWGGDHFDDADHYSIYGDPFVTLGAGSAKVAVWKYTPGLPGSSVPAFLTTDLAAAIDLQLTGVGFGGDVWSHLVEEMDVDATMVQGGKLLFSIAPTIVPGTPIFFDGGEIFVYDGPGLPTKYLHHAGHDWDTTFGVVAAFSHLGVASENINALEAVATPEPSSLILALLGLVALVGRRRNSR